MFFGIITLLTALSMATVAAVFAIYGIIAIFAGMPEFALVMGAVIELGKVVGVSWLYRNWNEPTKIKYAMLPLVLLAMLLTSMGIFGMLSKAHLEQTAPVSNNQLQIERIEQQISREQAKIIDSDSIISQLDQSVQVLINFDRIRGPDGALAIRDQQAPQRDMLREIITEAQKEIDQLEDRKLELSQELRSVELEVGPIKYIAELVYGKETTEIDQAVRLVIIAFIFVFDPMAILLLMAANYTLDQRKQAKELLKQPTLALEPEPSNPVDESITEHTTETTVEPSYPSAVDDAALAIFEFASKKNNKEPVDIITEGVTLAKDIGDGYIEYNNHLYQKNALKELKPDLFKFNDVFGDQFPKVAQKNKIFIRTDTTPHRAFKYDGYKWNEVNKIDTSFDQEYIKYLVDQIEKNNYDIDLLSDQEKIDIENYLTNR
jgi:multisubunit Na+/H+ antiporter MnhG subunit